MRQLCAVEGCGRRRYALRLCSMHYQRLKAKGELAAVPRTYRVRHGMSRSVEYGAWAQMRHRAKRRCEEVEAGWDGSFEAFFASLGVKPKGARLERLDRDFGWVRGNVFWMKRGENGQ